MTDNKSNAKSNAAKANKSKANKAPRAAAPVAPGAKGIGRETHLTLAIAEYGNAAAIAAAANQLAELTGKPAGAAEGAALQALLERPQARLVAPALVLAGREAGNERSLALFRAVNACFKRAVNGLTEEEIVFTPASVGATLPCKFSTTERVGKAEAARVAGELSARALAVAIDACTGVAERVAAAVKAQKETWKREAEGFENARKLSAALQVDPAAAGAAAGAALDETAKAIAQAIA